jgi:DNA-binding NarL/FixJ family response regulator
MQRKRKGPRSVFPTLREQDILNLVAECQTNYAIRVELGISQRTVENIVHRFMKKVGIHNRAHLIRYAQEHGYGRRKVSA